MKNLFSRKNISKNLFYGNGFLKDRNRIRRSVLKRSFTERKGNDGSNSDWSSNLRNYLLSGSIGSIGTMALIGIKDYMKDVAVLKYEHGKREKERVFIKKESAKEDFLTLLTNIINSSDYLIDWNFGLGNINGYYSDERHLERIISKADSIGSKPDSIWRQEMNYVKQFALLSKWLVKGARRLKEIHVLTESDSLVKMSKEYESLKKNFEDLKKEIEKYKSSEFREEREESKLLAACQNLILIFGAKVVKDKKKEKIIESLKIYSRHSLNLWNKSETLIINSIFLKFHEIDIKRENKDLDDMDMPREHLETLKKRLKSVENIDFKDIKNSEKFRSLKAYYYAYMGRIERALGNDLEASDYFDKAIQLYETLKEQGELYQVLLSETLIFKNTISSLNRAIGLLKNVIKNNSRYGLANFRLSQAYRCYTNASGEYFLELALCYLDKSRNLYQNKLTSRNFPKEFDDTLSEFLKEEERIDNSLKKLNINLDSKSIDCKPLISRDLLSKDLLQNLSCMRKEEDLQDSDVSLSIKNSKS